MLAPATSERADQRQQTAEHTEPATRMASVQEPGSETPPPLERMLATTPPQLVRRLGGASAPRDAGSATLPQLLAAFRQSRSVSPGPLAESPAAARSAAGSGLLLPTLRRLLVFGTATAANSSPAALDDFEIAQRSESVRASTIVVSGTRNSSQTRSPVGESGLRPRASIVELSSTPATAPISRPPVREAAPYVPPPQRAVALQPQFGAAGSPVGVPAQPPRSSALGQALRIQQQMHELQHGGQMFNAGAPPHRHGSMPLPRRQAPPPASLHPSFRSKSVVRLDCRYCGQHLCQRGMKAILLANVRVELYSTDAAPTCVQLINDNYTTNNCQCQIRDVACLGCGNVVGYHVTAPCHACMSSNNNGHFYMFFEEGVVSCERVDPRTNQCLYWGHLAFMDDSDPVERRCEVVCR